MKKLLTFLTLLTLFFTTGWATEETVDFSAQGYTNGQEITSYTGTNFSVTFSKGSGNNTPKYYNTGTAIRCYGGNQFYVSSKSSTEKITSIVITFSSGEDNNEITTVNGSYSEGTWTGNAESVIFSIGGSTGHRRIKALAVTTESGGTTPTTYSITGTGIQTGGTVTATATSNIAEGTSITITATPSSGYDLSNLTVDGNDVTNSVNDSYEYTFNMPAHNVAVSATFETPSTGDLYELVTDESTLSSGDKIVLLTGTIGNIYALSTNINTNNIDAIEVNVSTNGKYYHNSNSVEVLELASTTGNWPWQLKSTIGAPGQYLQSRTGNNNGLQYNDGTAENSKATITISNNAASIKFNANRGLICLNGTIFSCYANQSSYGKVYIFKKVETGDHSITVGTITGEGTITPSETSANTGETITVTATPGTGYELTSLAYNGTAIDITSTPYTFNMPNADVTLTATFSLKNYVVAYQVTPSTAAANSGNRVGLISGAPYDSQSGASYSQMGTSVTFKLYTGNGWQVDDANVSVAYTDANGNPATLTPTKGDTNSDDGGYGTYFTFTMPGSDVMINAAYLPYQPDLYILGNVNGGTHWNDGGLKMTFDASANTYSIRIYASEENGYFRFYANGGINGNPSYGAGGINLNPLEGTQPKDLWKDGDANFCVPAGIYDIVVGQIYDDPTTNSNPNWWDQTTVRVTKVEPTFTFNPADNSTVYQGTNVTVTSNLYDLLHAINSEITTVSVANEVSLDGTTYDESVALNTVGNQTVTGKASYGNYLSSTATANYTVVEVAGDVYTLVTNANDIDENSEYVIVTSKAFNNQYYAFGAISGGTAAQSTDFALAGNKVILTGESVNVLTIKGSASNGFDIQELSGNYLYGTSGGNLVSTNDESNVEYYWNITIDDNNLAKISYGETPTRSIIYRESAGGFKNYATSNANSSGYSTVQLYKKGSVTPQVETPTFNPEEGTYTEAQSVTINCGTQGATIYYTTNGNTPTVQYGTEYTGAINVTNTTTIKAIAVKEGYRNSEIATATYTIHTSVIGEGNFTLVESGDEIEANREYIIINSAKDKAASTYANNRLTSTENFELLDDDKTASIESDVKIFILEASENNGKYYLKDSEGNYYTPATSSGNITQTKTELTIQYSDGYVVITSGTVGSTRQIGYNEQGGQEVFGSFTPSSISPTGNGTLRPIYLYFRGGATVAKPVINPASQTFTEEFDATITCATQGATIYYTLDGCDPTTSSAVYSSPIHVDKTMTIKAIAEKDGQVSGIAEAVYQCTMVENIAEYLELPIGTEDIVFKNPVVVQYHYISSSGKSYIYVKDETGCAYFHQPYEIEGTPSMEQLENGDVIGARFYGDKEPDEAVGNNQSIYSMFTNLQNFAATGNKALAEPELKTVSDIIANNAAELNNHYITIKKVKLSELYQALSYGGAKYFDIYDETGEIGQAHIGYNKFNIDWSIVDEDDETAFYNITGIFTAYNNNLEFHPTEVVKWAEKEVTLADLCKNGEENENYKITNNLQGVVANGASLWVKDDNLSIWKTSPESNDQNFAIEDENNTRLEQGDYDQSNWLEIVFPDAATAKSFENKIIEGYSIEGVFNNKTNPKLTLAASAQVKAYGTSDEYAPNYYMPTNFTGSQNCATGVHGHFFFMNPKPQEYAQIVWAVWDRSVHKMMITNDPVQNSHQFNGEFSIDLELNYEDGYKDPDMITDGGIFNFKAIIRKVSESKNDISDSYMVYPLDFSENSNPPTAINTVETGNGEVKSVKYVNVAGIVSDTPFEGVNIVVTEYTDGSRTTTKMLKR